MNTLDITTIEDDSVNKKIKQVASRLYGKYTRKRKINEAKIEKQSKTANKVLSIIFSVIMIILALLAGVFCVGTVLCKVNNAPPTFMGYSFMQVLTGSMTSETIEINGVTYESGHKKGENIVIRSVDTDTLKVGNKIAFVVYAESFNEYYKNERKEISPNANTKYNASFARLLGFYPDEIYTACKNGSRVVFHHVVEIYEDEFGARWFKTEGSSVGMKDYWVIKEDYVLGIYDTSRSGEVLSVMLNFMTTSLGFYLVILFPVILVGILWLGEVLRNLYYAKLECDVVEQKRKITDEICRKAQIGYRMSNKTKLKVLAQASLEEKQEYINLLWKGGKAPNKIKKYYIEKRILLKPIQQLLEVNQKCEKMLADQASHEDIARYYIKEKKNIKQQETRIKKQLKTIRAKYQREKKSAKD